MPTLLAVLLAPLMAGCTSPGTPPAQDEVTVHVPPPAAGATYTYAGDDGSRLEVAVNGTPTRVGRDLDPRRVVRLSWTLTTPNRSGRNPSQATFRLREMIAPRSGRVVQQVAVCGVRWDGEAPAEKEADRACYDERATAIFSAAGLPGAFGAGPHWNRSLVSGQTVQVPVRPLGVGNATLRYVVATADGADRACVRLEAGSAPTGVASGLHWTVVQGPVVICRGLGLPVRFTGWDGRTYRLVGHEAGGDRLDVDGRQAPAVEGPLPTRNVESPLLVDDPTDPSNFSARTAHQMALDRSDPYQALWEDAADPQLRSTFFQNRSGVTRFHLGDRTVSQDTDRTRCVTAQDPATLRIVEVCIEKDDADMLEEEPSYEVVKEREDRLPTAVNVSGLPGQQTAIRGARDLAREVMGEEPMWWSQWFGARASPWSPQKGGETSLLFRSDGYSADVFFRDPTPIRGSLAQIPYQYRFDGPTRTVQWLYMNRTRLPLIDQI